MYCSLRELDRKQIQYFYDDTGVLLTCIHTLENKAIADGISLLATNFITLAIDLDPQKMTLTLSCDFDMQTRPRFLSNLRNQKAECRYLQYFFFKLSCEQTDTHTSNNIHCES